MIILALDSSGLVASVAIANEEALLAEYTIIIRRLIRKHYCLCWMK